jgi:hypothetical protein
MAGVVPLVVFILFISLIAGQSIKSYTWSFVDIMIMIHPIVIIPVESKIFFLSSSKPFSRFISGPKETNPFQLHVSVADDRTLWSLPQTTYRRDWSWGVSDFVRHYLSGSFQ